MATKGQTINQLLTQIDLRLTALNGLRSDLGQPAVPGPTVPDFNSLPTNKVADAKHSFIDYLRKFRAGLDKQIDSAKKAKPDAQSIFPTADELSGTRGDPANHEGSPDIADVPKQSAGSSKGSTTAIEGFAGLTLIGVLIWLARKKFK